jgi:hypothetical protein
MKALLKYIIPFCILTAGTSPSSGIVQVQDISLVRTHLWTARREWTEQIFQGKRQLEQLQGLYSQIKQAETHLQRLGDPREVTLETLRDALGFLQQVNLSQTFEDLIKDLRGDELFSRSSSPVMTKVDRVIRVDGQEVAETDASVFRPEVASHRASEHYREVRDAALEERPKIKAEMNRTLQQLKSASTTSEIQKLNIVMRSLESQLAANDREIGFASSGVVATYLRNQNEKEIEAKLRVQRQRAALRYSTEKDLILYEISSEPIPFKR